MAMGDVGTNSGKRVGRVAKESTSKRKSAAVARTWRLMRTRRLSPLLRASWRVENRPLVPGSAGDIDRSSPEPTPGVVIVRTGAPFTRKYSVTLAALCGMERTVAVMIFDAPRASSTVRCHPYFRSRIPVACANLPSDFSAADI